MKKETQKNKKTKTREAKDKTKVVKAGKKLKTVPARIKTEEKKPLKKEKRETTQYCQAVGRRKTAVARIRLFTRGGKEFLINEKPLQRYFPTFELQQIATGALEKMKCFDRFGILVRVKGGGIHAQAEAVRHGIARALVEFNPDFRKRLRRVGYLTRDPRQRERKKFGLKRARRAPQWQKR